MLMLDFKTKPPHLYANEESVVGKNRRVKFTVCLSLLFSLMCCDAFSLALPEIPSLPFALLPLTHSLQLSYSLF